MLTGWTSKILTSLLRQNCYKLLHPSKRQQRNCQSFSQGRKWCVLTANCTASLILTTECAFPLQTADESLNFEEQILKAAKNIAAATSALIKSATAAQRELVAQGKLSSHPKSEDSQWSEGLVSAVSLTLSGHHTGLFTPVSQLWMERSKFRGAWLPSHLVMFLFSYCRLSWLPRLPRPCARQPTASSRERQKRRS